MNQEELAIASVPIQHWGQIYEPDKAFCRGTIFPDLDKPFYVTETGGADKSASSQGSILKAMENQGKKQEEYSLRQIQEISFVLADLRLYLDTHPRDVNGLELLKTAAQKRKELLREFARNFYPLTGDCMAEIYETNPASECYCWQSGPIPWEGGCV